jgi:hypothetical protein
MLKFLQSASEEFPNARKSMIDVKLAAERAVVLVQKP